LIWKLDTHNISRKLENWLKLVENSGFKKLDTGTIWSFNIAMDNMLNDQMVPVSSFLKPEFSTSFNQFSSFLEIL
jgi:hypothetical protein